MVHTLKLVVSLCKNQLQINYVQKLIQKYLSQPTLNRALKKLIISEKAFVTFGIPILTLKIYLLNNQNKKM